MKKHNSHPEHQVEIPDIDLIDLDKEPADIQKDFKESKDNDSADEEENPLLRFLFRVNWHLVLLAVLLFSVAAIVYLIANWGTRVHLNEDEFEEHDYDILDNILPSFYEGENMDTDGITTIVALGNNILADDKNSPDSITNLISQKTGATVYNCAVSDSFLAASGETFRAEEDPMDAFNFYWLTTLLCLGNDSPCNQALDAMGELPEDAQYAFDTLSSLDFTTVDAIMIMYDASDYLGGRSLYNEENPTDIQTFTGNLAAGIQLIQDTYPWIRIIVMSPTYAYAVNEDGEYVSSYLYVYNKYTLGTYSNLIEIQIYNLYVTFVDNLYGTINEDNAELYLIDNLYPNQEGRELIADRFIYALQYFDKNK